MYLNTLQIIADNNKGSESRIAQYLLDNKEYIMDLKVSKISDEAYVSMSSISRLTKKLNVTDFATLKIELAKELKDLEYAKNLKASPSILKVLESFRQLNSEQLIDFISNYRNKKINIISSVDLFFIHDVLFKEKINIVDTIKDNDELYVSVTFTNEYNINFRENVLEVNIKDNDDILIQRIFIMSLITMMMEDRA